MNTPPDGPLVNQLHAGAGNIVVGDVGFAVVKSMLELPFGYAISGTVDRANPIDAALDDVSLSFLRPAGIALRRMRSATEIGSAIADLSARGPGLVVWSGVRGMRPALERFTRIEVEQPVVGITFDVSALRCSAGLVLDPAPGIIGLREAIAEALARSARQKRPACVLIRSATLGARAAFPAADNIPAGLRDGAALVGEDFPKIAPDVGRDVVICGRPIADVIREAIGTHPVNMVDVMAPCDLDDDSLRAGIGAARRVLIVDDAAAPALHERLLARPFREPGSLAVTRIAYDDLGSRDARQLIDEWREEAVARAEGVDNESSRLGAAIARPGRELPTHIEAALVVACSDLGVPVRTDLNRPTYALHGGGAVTLTSLDGLLAAPEAILSPEATAGCVVVWGAASQAGLLSEYASSLGMRVAVHDGSRPRAVGQAIAGAARGGRMLLLVTPPAPIRVSAAAELGVEPALIEGHDLALGGLPRAAVSRVHRADEILADTAVVPTDDDLVRNSLSGALELGGGWYQITRSPAGGLGGRMKMAWRRWVTRNIGRTEA